MQKENHYLGFMSNMTGKIGFEQLTLTNSLIDFCYSVNEVLRF